MGDDRCEFSQSDNQFESRFDPLDPAIRSLIFHEARRLLGQAGISKSDIDDLSQDFVVYLLLGTMLFDPELSAAPTFARVVLARAAAKLLRHRQAAKRDVRRTVSLDQLLERWTAPVRSCEGAIPELTAPDPVVSTQLNMDIAETIKKLPARLRELAEALMSNSISEIARQTGIPRTTLSSRKKEILERFRQAGLDEYLK